MFILIWVKDEILFSRKYLTPVNTMLPLTASESSFIASESLLTPIESKHTASESSFG